MIPAVSQIEDSLANITIAESSAPYPGGDVCIVVCERLKRLHSDGTLSQDGTALVLNQGPNAPMSLSRLVTKIADELQHVGHPHVAPKTEQRFLLATKVLAVATAFGSSTTDKLKVLNAVVGAIAPARVSQWVVLPNPATSAEQYKFGDFVYGEIELEKLQYRCEKAGSDYFKLYCGNLRGRRSILRETGDVKTVDINAIRPPHTPSSSDTRFLHRIVDDYFGNIAEAEQRRFMEDLDRQQAIFGAVGLGTIPAGALRQMSAYAQWITVFERQARGHGWVVPNAACFSISSTEPKALSDGQNAIKESLMLDDWGKRSLDPSIQAFCQYLMTAHDHEHSGHVEEAILHVVFALDLLLGGKAGEALTLVLAQRVAIVSHLPQQQGIGEVIAFVKQCYDMRSGYVHRGERGRLTGLSERLEQLTQVARAVLGAACFARRQAWAETKEARDSWISRIDVLRAKHAAGMAFETSDLSGLGLNDVRLRPGELVGVQSGSSRSQ